jgi:threonine/homoserine/homoserine lactone efflux protein
VVERSAHILTAVKFAGAAYLVYLGVQAIRHRKSMAEALAAQLRPVTPLRAVRDGFVVGAANPKTIVFFIVALPEFTSRAAGHLPVQAQMLVLGALFPSSRSCWTACGRPWPARPGSGSHRHRGGWR